ncbi:MAG: adenylate kinase [Planctomycetota bacterium]
MASKRYIFLGPPGAGKGTQAVLLADKYQIPHISTGEILRSAVREGTELGVTAKQFMDRGDLVPDEVVAGVVAERLGEDDCKAGCLLDGFPRTLPQARALEERTVGEEYTVVYFGLPEEEVVVRLTGRRTCPNCAANFHVTYLPPKVEGKCDNCGHELVQRSDDTEETVLERLRVYREQTGDLVDYYRERGHLLEVPATGAPEEVYDLLLRTLENG